LLLHGATSQKLQRNDGGDACQGAQETGFHIDGSNEADVMLPAKRILETRARLACAPEQTGVR
jgi:hypothetical protein